MGALIHAIDLDIETDYCGCENCPDVLVKSRPDIIQDIHEQYLRAGADAIYTDSFGGASHVLSEFDLQDETFELNKRAAEIARAAADKHTTSDKPRYVLGSMGPGTKLITLGQIDWDAMRASYAQAMRGLIAGGADAIMIETCQDLLQVKCAINAAIAALDESGKTPGDIPIMVSVTIEQTGAMLLGTSIEGALAALRGYPIASLGLNCATGPTEMTEHIHHLSKHWDRHVTVLPNAGLPVLVDGKTEYPLQPQAFAEAMQRFIERDAISAAGGCCGTTPEHIKLLADAVADRAPAKRAPTPPRPSATSLYSPTEFRQDASFLIVGERCNASGSRKFKRLLEEEDWDSIVSLAREQVREGSHILDINVDYAGRDNASDMAQVVSRFVQQVDAPLMLDSTQPKTIEAGLKHAAGKCVINSANFEDGQDKFDDMCRLAKRYNAALVIGTIDEDREAAMARTADRKLAIATRAIERATREHGLPIGDLFIDPLVLPISTGMDADRRSALELIEGTRRIAEAFPEVQITCGLSNVSFGLKPAARVILNSVFLHELVEAGMTSAIVHASKILPLNKIEEAHKLAALNLIYDRRDTSAFIDLFADVDSVQDAKKEMTNLTLEERLRAHIIDGEKEGLAECIDEAMTKYPPLQIINEHLLDGMKTVGVLFGSGQMQLPFVLQSAEVMKMAVARLEPHMEKVEGPDGNKSKGSIVLATVKGDVHDIGKNLVDIILTNNGYTVHNLGIKQPITDILKAWRDTNADAIGLSGLLVKSVNVMEDNLKELNDQGVTVPVILGGAALTRSYAEGYLRSIYTGSCLYGKDAFEGLRIMDLLASDQLTTIEQEITERQDARSEAKKAHDEKRSQSSPDPAGEVSAQRTEGARSEIPRDTPVPAAPFLGSRVVTDIPLDSIYPYINPTALFATQWQLKRGPRSKSEHEAYLQEHAQPVFDRLKNQCAAENILKPAVVYGYYPCWSDGQDLVVFDATDHDKEIERFSFPRQTTKRALCIADFFKDADECKALGRKDVLGLSCVTMGQKVSEVCKTLFESNDYTEYLYMHGMGVETAEALAELWHKRMRQELGFASEDSPKISELFQQKYRGSRYSFGYAACPDMSDQEKLWRLLEPGRIGCELTENWQIDPEQSTSALIVHHPSAKYFNA
eukprot:g5917.t1